MRAVCLLPLVLFAACSDATRPDDSAACRQTREFGNTGCVEIAGTVVDSRGAPVAGASVSAGAVADRAIAFAGGTRTDALGRYALRAVRMAGQPLRPDTVTVYVRATVAPTLPATVGPRDSTTLVVEVAPVGFVPATSQAPVLTIPLR
jgi:hypothetical protein